MGYMSQRVLGQYELSLLQPEIPPRLLFVTPNLRARRARPRGGRGELPALGRRCTRSRTCSSSPASRGCASTSARCCASTSATVEVRIERGAAGGLPSLPDPSLIVERFREGGLAALVQTREQRRIMERIQCAMAVVEGYSEHVMDAVGADVLPQYDGLREAMEAPPAQPLGARARSCCACSASTRR